MGIYNGVWEHLYRRFILHELTTNDRTVLLPSYDETSPYTSVPGASDIPSNAGVYIPTEKDTINA